MGELETLVVSPETRQTIIELMVRLGLFFVGAILSPLIGQTLPRVIRLLFYITRYIDIDDQAMYDKYVKPVEGSLVVSGTLFFITRWLDLLDNYEGLYEFLRFFIYLALSISVAWLTSRIARRVIQLSAIQMFRQLSGEVNDVILVFETITNIVVIVLAVAFFFSEGLDVNLVAISASISIGGVAVGFAAQQALSRLIGTIELYLDRPYSPGEYIRVNFNPYREDIYGRVESIGIRSTRIRTVAKNTILIVPNSEMAGKPIENITRGKKVMAMLCLDFTEKLRDTEKALVKQVIEESSHAFSGIDKTSTRIQFSTPENKENTRAIVNFFITGSGNDSLSLRKRLLEMAHETMARRLNSYNLEFTVPEPLV